MSPGVVEVASVCVTRVVVPSERCGSIWKMPPWAQSLACTFIDRPVPVRETTRSSSSSSTETALLSTSPRWSGTLLANTGVNRPPVMSIGLAAPVNAWFSTAKSADRTSNCA